MRDTIYTENDINEAMDEKLNYCKNIEQAEKSNKINLYYDVEEHYENVNENVDVFMKNDVTSQFVPSALIKTSDASCGELCRKNTKSYLMVSVALNVIFAVCICFIVLRLWSPDKDLNATCERDISLSDPICLPCIEMNSRMSVGRPVVIQANKAAPLLCCIENNLHLHFLLKMILMEKQRIKVPKENRKPPFFMNLPTKTAGDSLDWKKPRSNKIHVNETGTYAIIISVVLQTEGDMGVNNFTAAIHNYRSFGRSVIAEKKVSIHGNPGITFKGCQIFDVVKLSKGDNLSLELSNVHLIYRYRIMNYFGMMKIQ